ncbi:MAG: VanZ family protein, partial [Anaerolineae bacterium]|nr:VanZ family protein [Anaerolineae bacterium]
MNVNRERSFQVLFVLYLLGVIFVSLIPGTVFLSSSVAHLDKVGHFFAYTGLGFLIGLTFRHRNGRLLVAVGVIFLGFLLEWGQSFVPGRDMSLADGLVNTCGVILGGL